MKSMHPVRQVILEIDNKIEEVGGAAGYWATVGVVGAGVIGLLYLLWKD